MRPFLIAAVATGALLAGVAVAQTPPPGGPDGGPPPPHEMHERWGHGFMRGHPPMPPPPKAAVFRFRKGDASVFVKCADDEPTKACTDAMQAMLGAINAAPAPAPAR